MFCFTKLCRLCLTKDDTLIDYIEDISLYEKLFEIMPRMMVDSYEQFPTMICSKCKNQVDLTYKFMKDCMKSHQLLHNYYLQLKTVNTSNDENMYSLQVLVSDETTTTKLEETFEEVAVKTEPIINNYESENSIDSLNDLNNIKFKCAVCEELFDSVANLTAHYQSHSYIQQQQQEHKCKLCKKTFKDVSSLQYHVDVRHRDIIENLCRICGQSFGLKTILMMHMNNAHPNESLLLKNNTCFEKVDDIVNETNTIHIKTEPLAEENNTTNTTFDLNPTTTINECAICLKRCDTSLELVQHMTSHPSPYKCFLCLLVYKNPNHFERHFISVHTTAPVYPCDICKITFNTVKKLKLHKNQAHLKYQCNLCEKTFTTTKSLRNHLNSIHSGVQLLKCDLCNERFTHKRLLFAHRDSVHYKIICHKSSNEQNVDINKCDVCDVKFINENLLKEHKAIHYHESTINKEGTHNIGSKLFQLLTQKNDEKQVTIINSECADNINLNVANKTRQYTWCVVCSIIFMDRTALRKHVRRNHPQPYSCILCSKTFERWLNLERHHRGVHMQERPFPCDLCGNTYKTLRCLKYHKNTRHFKRKDFQCGICKRSFTKATYLRYHFKNLHLNKTTEKSEGQQQIPSTELSITNIIDEENKKQEEEKCYSQNKEDDDECIHEESNNSNSENKNKPATIVTNSENTTKLIIDKTNLKCPVCRKKFSNASNVRKHYRIVHDQERPFKCDKCNKTFTEIGSLKYHKKVTHLGIKDFQCQFCSKQFGIKTALRLHLRAVHSFKNINEKQCNICDQIFLNGKTLQKHMQKKHKNVSASITETSIDNGETVSPENFIDVDTIR